jgi:cytochrome P450
MADDAPSTFQTAVPWQTSQKPLSAEEKEWVARHFDATDVVRMQDPFRLFRFLRDQHPVAQSDVGGRTSWVLSRYEDVRRVARDHEHFVSSGGVGVSPLGNDRPMIPIETDPPDHAVYRRMIGDLFSPPAIAQCEASVRAVTRELISAIVDGGQRRCDLVRDLTYEQPMRVMWAEPFLGDPLVPVGTAGSTASATFRSWVHDFKHDPARTRAAAAKMRAHVETVLEDRRRHPLNDIPTRLLAAEIDGQPMSFDSAADFMFTLFSAGTATTGDALSGTFLYLATRPDEAERIRRRQVDADRTIDELIRYFGPSQAEGRTVAADVTIGGVKIRSGDAVQILWNSANRDERTFDRPDDVDLERSPNPHIGFGTGIHRCLGLHLARLQVRVAVEEWLDAVGDFGLSENATVEWSVGLDRSLRVLDVEW